MDVGGEVEEVVVVILELTELLREILQFSVIVVLSVGVFEGEHVV